MHIAPLRVAVLCNDRLGLPALQQLTQNRLIQAVATTDRSPEMVGIMQLITQQGGVPSTVFSHTNFETALLNWLEEFKPDVVLVKTFPFRIPLSALKLPKFGFVNFHYAPLPEYRGSNPIFWMIKNGVTTGGVAVHRMDEHFDTGPILLQESVTFPPESSFGLCSTLLGHTGAKLTQQLLFGLKSGTLQENPQDESKQNRFNKPQPNDFVIQWNTMTSTAIIALANACNPWVKGAQTRIKKMPVNILNASISELIVPENALPGTIIELSANKGLHITCSDNKAIKVHVICLEDGFYSGVQFQKYGFKTGDQLG